ncbi:response regulator [Actinoplanes missouriensis]
MAGSTPFARPGRPDLVLLDLNLPGGDGRMVLRHIRADPATAAVPVVLLVDSPAAEEILRAESLQVQGYAVKPIDFDRLVAIVGSLTELGFWFPSRRRAL